eukprot:3498106-Alexandrium_andersonii.AAC.1
MPSERAGVGQRQLRGWRAMQGVWPLLWLMGFPVLLPVAMSVAQRGAVDSFGPALLRRLFAL